MLRELEEAAEKRVLERGKLENNVLEARWVVLQNHQTDTQDLHLRMSINGKEVHLKTEVCGWPGLDPNEKARRIYARVVEGLADELFKGLLGDQSSMRDLFPRLQR